MKNVIKAILSRSKRFLRLLGALPKVRLYSESEWGNKRPLVSVMIRSSKDISDDCPAISSVNGQAFTDFELLQEGHINPTTSSFQQALAKARGKYIVCLRPKDVVDVTFLEKTLFLAENMKFDSVRVVDEMGFPQKQVALFRTEFMKRALRQSSEALPSRTRISGREHVIPENLVTLGHQVQESSCFPKIEIDTTKTSERIYLNLRPLINIKTPQPRVRQSLALFVPSFELGGADTVARAIEKVMRRTFDIQVVVTDRQGAPDQEKIKAAHAQNTPQIYELCSLIPEVWGTSLRAMLIKRFLAYFLRLHTPRYIYQGGSRLLYLYLPLIKKQLPTVTIFDHQFNEQGHIHNLSKYRSFIDSALVESEYMKKVVQKAVPGMHTEILAMGVDLQRFRPGRRRRHRIGDFRLPRDKPIVAFVGRLSEEKGADIFIECARQMKDRAVHFIIVGQGPLEESIRQQLQKGHDRNILLIGFVDDVALVYPECDILVVPSRLDGSPIVIKEALASGVPVIGSRVGGIPEMIPEKSMKEYLCIPNSPREINNSILSIISKNKEMACLKLILRQTAEGSFREGTFQEQCSRLFR